MNKKQINMKTEEQTKIALELVSTIMDGTITEDSLGTALKAMQINMAAALVVNQNKAVAMVEGMHSHYQKLQKRFDELIINEISTMTDAESVFEWIEKIHNMQLRTLEVQRKIVQGKELFNTTVLTPEEKLVSQLFSSLTTKAKKEEFLSLVKKSMEDNSFED